MSVCSECDKIRNRQAVTWPSRLKIRVTSATETVTMPGCSQVGDVCEDSPEGFAASVGKRRIHDPVKLTTRRGRTQSKRNPNARRRRKDPTGDGTGGRIWTGAGHRCGRGKNVSRVHSGEVAYSQEEQ